MPALQLTVNGAPVRLDVPCEATLLHLLRNDLRLNGPKYGCGLGQCGACTVHVDGVAARACVIPAHGVAGRSITTLEGLGQTWAPARATPHEPAAPAAVRPGHVAVGDAAPHAPWHPVQAAFAQAQAAQCGYCLNGMVMQTAALLAREPRPGAARVRAELAGNLCRCGTHVEILQAVALAAEALQGAPVSSAKSGSDADVESAGSYEIRS